MLFSKNDIKMDNLLSLSILHSGGFTHKDLKKLFEYTQNYSDILEDFLHECNTQTAWMTADRRAKILEKIPTIDIAKLEKIRNEKNIEVITIHSENYPEKLRTIKQSPYLLYVR
jgi:predicted Rossmann fold nucleotide-binding protein DprA/Smf involved in DNA uptake